MALRMSAVGLRKIHLYFLPYFLMLFCGTVWGTTFSLARIATSENAHPLGLSFWLASGGGLVLLVIGLVRRVWPPLDRDSLVRYVVIGSIGSIIPGTLYFYAASRVPSGILAITITLVPMMTYLLSLVLGVDAYQRKRFIGILIGFAAILLLVIPESSLPDPGMTKWLLLALLACAFYTIETLYVDVLIPDNTDMVALLSGGLIMASIGMIPILYFQDAWVPLNFPFTKIEWSIVAMAVVSSLAYATFFLLVKMAGAVFASLSGYVITTAGVFWGIVIFDETHSIWVWSAFALLLVGMALVTPREKIVTEKTVAEKTAAEKTAARK
ncbi:DMT family transporter [Candidatus Spongiihabitans sp.]|uniref:DMT family transporter n=1 Tax=Candidatus Spongiihabitans sp. TaxID=3101308 RepID=UPI003C7D8B37